MSMCLDTPAQASSPQNTLRLDNKTYKAPTNGLITPPESPIEDVIPRDSLEPKRNILVTATGPNIIMVNGVTYSPGQIQAMANVLVQARRNGDFPQTSALPMDAKAIVEDYEDLLKLRATYGDFTTPAPEDYRLLRVEIARRIQERDTALSENDNKAEAARRVDTYLRSVEQERRYFDIANTMLQRRGVTNPTQVDFENVGEEICTIVEQAAEQSAEYIEHTMADTTGPLRLNIGHLKDEASKFRDQNDALGQYITHQQHALQLQSEKLAAMESLVVPQAMNLQAMSHNLATISNLVNQLSQVVTHMPTSINQIVDTAVQTQAEAAINNVMSAQGRLMAEISLESSRMDNPPMHQLFVGMGSGDPASGVDSGIGSLRSRCTVSRETRPQVIKFEKRSKNGKGKMLKVIRKVLRRDD
ncbi:Fc.00g014990.m01.CDS01 [Cosmosporella sp. VM-42]